jgi:hypothetical protein
MGASCVADTEGATVHIFPACGSPHNDIVVAFADSVFAYCNEGDGTTFEEGDFWGPWTIRWDLNGPAHPSAMRVFPAHSPQPGLPSDTLFAVNGSDSVIVQLSRSENVYGKNFLTVLAIRNGHRPLEMVLSSHTGTETDWWERAAWVGNARSGDITTDGQMGFGR